MSDKMCVDPNCNYAVFGAVCTKCGTIQKLSEPQDPIGCDMEKFTKDELDLIEYKANTSIESGIRLLKDRVALRLSVGNIKMIQIELDLERSILDKVRKM